MILLHCIVNIISAKRLLGLLYVGHDLELLKVKQWARFICSVPAVVSDFSSCLFESLQQFKSVSDVFLQIRSVSLENNRTDSLVQMHLFLQ